MDALIQEKDNYNVTAKDAKVTANEYTRMLEYITRLQSNYWITTKAK